MWERSMQNFTAASLGAIKSNFFFENGAIKSEFVVRSFRFSLPGRSQL